MSRMRAIMNPKMVVGGALAAAVLLVGALVLVNPFASDAEGPTVDLAQDGALVDRMPASEAAAAGSKRVGYKVKLAKSVPAGLELKSIDFSLGPEELAKNALKFANLTYLPKDETQRGTASVYVEQTVRFGPPGGEAQKFDVGVSGVEAYIQTGEKATVYWLFTADHGFLVSVRGSAPPNEAQMREMLASLAR